MMLAGLVAALLGCSPKDELSRPPGRPWGPPGPWFQVTDSRLNECSGIGAANRRPRRWVAHNDSGDTARFFTVDETGAVLGVTRLAGAEAIDWEDMEAVVVGGVAWLYFADVGDNASRRPVVRIYRVREPLDPVEEIAQVETFELLYPDGPRNAETLVVDPKSGDAYIVSKVGGRAASVYRLPGDANPGRHTLEKLGEVAVRDENDRFELVTGGSASPDGRFVVLRTYLNAYEFSVRGRFRDWFRQPAARLRTALENQGEAIAYARDGKAIVTASEGTPCPFHRMSLAKPR
jgi:hypothetical protein